MADASEEPLDGGGDPGARDQVELERAELREFVTNLSPDDIRSGRWFSELIAEALGAYTAKVDWQYFQERYPGVPADAIVEDRVRMAARYAALEGGLSAAAYTGAIAMTIKSRGGSSKATVPAAMATVMVDVAYVTRLQLRLAYDIAVLYRVPIDTSDPDDLWKLIRVAFTVKSGEVAREAVIKVVPALVRPLIKRFYSRSVLAAAKSLPVVGRHLLQRNVIKVGIPLVGVPLAVVVNRYTTLVAGRHARAVFRNEARIIELASEVSDRTEHPNVALWVAWLVITSDNKIGDEESLLFRHLVRSMQDRHQIADEKLEQVVDLDAADVWRRLDAESGDLSDLVALAGRVAEVDGPMNARERDVIDELEKRCAAASRSN